jgi:rod shape determining protein RodA
MALGLLPIAGIPLPFVSAGGSSLISSFAAMGICMNIRMRRYVN